MDYSALFYLIGCLVLGAYIIYRQVQFLQGDVALKDLEKFDFIFTIMRGLIFFILIPSCYFLGKRAFFKSA